ncbi:MAG: alcohol dehydrogenase catalytic domain-containing protein [Synergistaceae bacterium]|jgi:L-iditol 2-dehydrogenase|nr:alcohol dehydrogenase catalytic domain-containing protein [Synergistaceae bacterium]
MRAAIFKDIEDIRVEEVPQPKCPEGGILVEVHYCGICGGDVRNYHNGLKDGVKNQIMGHEIAGKIIEVSPSITRFKVGDRVAMAPDVSCGECWYCKRGLVNLCENHKMLGTHFPGGYAQFIALPDEVMTRGFVEPIPESMTYKHAAFAETCAAVIACQKRIDVSLGDDVVIIGDGPVGCLHLEIARARGAKKIIMLARDKIKLAERFRPDYLIDNLDVNAATKRILELTDGRGADIVILALPTVVVQDQALRIVRKRGKIVIYGGVPKDKEISQLNSNLIHYNEIEVTGSFSYSATGLSDALSALNSGVIHADMHINEVVSLDDVVKGMEMIQTGKALKVLIDPWKDNPALPEKYDIKKGFTCTR